MKKKSDEKTLEREEGKPQCAEPEIVADSGVAESAVWENDQKNHSYYYDDAHGYEIYDPEKDDEEEDD